MCRMCLAFSEKGTRLLKTFFTEWEKSNPDGYGFYCVTKKGNEILQKHPKNDKFNPPKITKMFLLHCRNKTSGWKNHNGNGEENHPFESCDKEILLAHNGYLYTYETLRKVLAKNHTFKSHVDSEVLVHLLESCLNQTNELTPQSIKVWFDELNRYDITGMLNVIALNRKTFEWFGISEGSLTLLKPLMSNDLFLASTNSPLKQIFAYEMEIPSGYCIIGKNNKVKDIFYVGKIGYSSVYKGYTTKSRTVSTPNNAQVIKNMFGMPYEEDTTYDEYGY